ncbi:MAG: hypothetical protein AAGL08_05855, partial [Cyanobacteria bacterium J06573_11]
MTTELLRSYNAVIEHALSKAIRLAAQSPKNKKLGRRGIAGFCQLQGPTGGGKSSSLYRSGFDDGVAPVLELIKDKKRQAILVTHRWNILLDIYKSVVSSVDGKQKPFSVSVLYSQLESVVSAVTRIPLQHETDLTSSDIPDPFDSIENLADRKLLAIKGLKEKLLRSCRSIAAAHRAIHNQKNSFLLTQKYLALQEEDLRKACSSVEHLLLDNMSALEKAVKQAKEEHGAENALTVAAAKRLEDFRKDVWVWRLFPAISWHDEKQHLLIMTTQKLFSSFYDGQNTVRMSSGQLNGHVIFMDEFDYQSDVLLGLLAQAQAVQEPPECLGQLLENGKRLLRRMPKPLSKIGERLKDFLEELEENLLEKNIDLSDARAFVTPSEETETKKKFKEQFLFRSDHLVTSSPVTMKRVDGGYEIREQKIGETADADAVNVSDFLRLMEKFIRKFSLMLSDLSASESEARAQISKLSGLLFDAANDYRPSYYSSAIPNLSIHALPRADLPELRLGLTDSNILPNTHANVFGLTNWLLYQNTSEIELDPHRIQVKRALLPTTPEGLLLSLSSRNLVFALSATSYIERAVGHFNTRWIADALKYIAEARTPTVTESSLGTALDGRPESWFKKPIPYVQEDSDRLLQQRMIAQISQRKSDIRNTVLKLQVNEFGQFQKSSEYQEMLSSLSPEFFQQDMDSIPDSVREYRQKVLCMLLDVISLAGNNPEHQGHLAFVNSIRYLRKWLCDQSASQSRDCMSWLKADSSFSEIISKEIAPARFEAETFNDVLIPVCVHNSPALICLLTAECQKRAGFSLAYQAAFGTGRVVLVLTQTASATNGINLDFFLPDSEQGDSDRRMDLTCLYLLESQYYYFSAFDEKDLNQDEMTHAGVQLRNLDKLCRAGELSRAEHRRNILPLMTNSRREINTLNKCYGQLEDYVKNIAANVQQQVGRLERTWRHVPQVNIYTAPTVAKTLTRFASMPMFTNNRLLISSLNIQLLEALLNRQSSEENDFLDQLMTPVQSGERAAEIIDDKLVPAIRESRIEGRDVDEIAKIWSQIGRAVLQHDYGWNPNSTRYGLDVSLREWACFERPTESNADDDIWYDPITWQFFSSPGRGRVRYSPERLYEYIKRHPSILDWFNRKGYRTSIIPFSNEREARYAFHPVVIQRLLQGRLGEEAIRALLFDKGIKTHTMLNNPMVLELYDFSVSNTDFRVDAKFWSQSSQDQADLEYQNWLSGGAEMDKAPL